METMTLKAETLWTNGDQSRYFLVDDEVLLTEGDFEIVHCSGTTRRNQGKVLKVSEASLQPYELSKAAAMNWAKEQMKAGLRRAGKTAMRFAGSKLSEWAAKSREAPKPRPEKPKGLDSDPRELGRKLEKILGLDTMSEEESKRFAGKMDRLKGLMQSIEGDLLRSVKRKQSRRDPG